ncbi:MAG TPA: hypothetical protein VFE90_15065 [Myxococcales bacterium]|jgi:hypothetical protein|nr:hypothetical protein [Myxococcales bacterium]
MEHLYLWPANPAASLLALFILSNVFLYAARHPMHKALREVGRLLGGAFRVSARWCRGMSAKVAQRDHEMIVEMGKGDVQAKVGREFHRIEGAYAKELARYPDLHRKLDDVLTKIDADFQETATAAPAAPGWSDAVTAVTKMPPTGDRVVTKLLEEIHKSAVAGEKKALQEFRDATAKKHKILGSMAPAWKELKKLAVDVGAAVTGALESTKRIDGYMAQFEKVRAADAKAIRALGWNATQLFVVSVLVMAVAMGGAFVNFNLIALPMSELVPSGSRIGGMPVSTVAALVIVLMEVAAGVFAMEMLGITSFFPKLELLPKSRRRIILTVAVGGLFMLACIEASLAVLREQIVESSTALKASLAGAAAAPVAQTASSRIPVIGQAVLGFILPWILAMVAVPLETMISTGGHIVLSAVAGVLYGLGMVCRLGGHGMRYLFEAVRHLYDVYIVIPLQVERVFANGSRETPPAAALRPEGRR